MQKPNSSPLSLLTFAKIKRKLEEALNTKVDLIGRTAIKPRLKKHRQKTKCRFKAVKHIPGEFRIRHKQVPWKDIAGLRDILVHEYFVVTLGMIWETATEDIPLLKSRQTTFLIHSMISRQSEQGRPLWSPFLSARNLY